MSNVDIATNDKYRVFSLNPLYNGCECFASNTEINECEYYVSSVTANHIRELDGRFYYTTEDLAEYADFYPAHILNISNKFTRTNHKKVKRCRNYNLADADLSSDRFIIDVSQLPAFSDSANEESKMYEYRVYITLFNDYTIKQCYYDRFNLYDAKINASKLDLVNKLQNSSILKSKDFTMINAKRSTDETVKIGLVLRSDENAKGVSEYGTIMIDMNNILSIIWH